MDIAGAVFLYPCYLHFAEPNSYQYGLLYPVPYGALTPLYTGVAPETADELYVPCVYPCPSACCHAPAGSKRTSGDESSTACRK